MLRYRPCFVQSFSLSNLIIKGVACLLLDTFEISSVQFSLHLAYSFSSGGVSIERVREYRIQYSIWYSTVGYELFHPWYDIKLILLLIEIDGGRLSLTSEDIIMHLVIDLLHCHAFCNYLWDLERHTLLCVRRSSRLMIDDDGWTDHVSPTMTQLLLFFVAGEGSCFDTPLIVKNPVILVPLLNKTVKTFPFPWTQPTAAVQFPKSSEHSTIEIETVLLEQRSNKWHKPHREWRASDAWRERLSS